MVTGDNIVTACSIAIECGLLRGNFDLDEAIKNKGSFEVMEGKLFRNLIGGLIVENKSNLLLKFNKYSIYLNSFRKTRRLS